MMGAPIAPRKRRAAMSTDPAIRPLEPWPPVSVVIPSLNQGRFIRQAIDSVLGQGYPNVELVVVDGGSSDGTVEILRSYGDRLRWSSEPDAGQSDALNTGFARVGGQVLTWLNADDALTEDAIGHAVEALRDRPGVGLVYGQGHILDEHGSVVGPFAEIEPPWLWRLLHLLDFVLQPAAFFRAAAVDGERVVDPGLRWCMDWDLWIRLAARADVHFLDDRVLGCSREHGATKTATGGLARVRELGRLVRRHTGRFWSPGIRLYALDTVARRLAPALPEVLAARLTSALAGASRRIACDLPAYADGWLGPRGAVVVPRRWGRTRIELELDRVPADRPVHLRISVDGSTVEELRLERPAVLERCLDLPATGRPFAEIGVLSDASFYAHPDPRRLAVRCTGVSAARPSCTSL
jgi:hypothetical protein